MRTLVANLRFFYQCRALWAVYSLIVVFPVVFLSVMHFGLRSIRAGVGNPTVSYFAQMSVVCAISYTVGLIAASLQMEVIAKPFSFCLPDYRSTSRRLIFVLGLAISLSESLVLSPSNVSANLPPLHFFGLGLLTYFVGVIIGLRFTSTVVLPALSVTPVLLMGGLLLDRGTSPGFGVAIPVTIGTAASGVCMAVIVWVWLSRPSLFRRRCGRLWPGISGMGSPAMWERYRSARFSVRTGDVPHSRANRFLLDALTSREHGSIAQHVLGTLYTWLLPGGGGRPHMAIGGLASVVAAIVASYRDTGTAGMMIGNAFVWSAATIGTSPLNSHLLIAGGRRERFLSTMALIVVFGAFMTGSLVFTFTALDLLGIHSPSQEMQGDESGSCLHMIMEQRMNLRTMVLLTAMFPISRLLEIRFRKWRAAIAQATLFILVTNLALWGGPWLTALPLMSVALILVLSWTVCVVGVHRVIMRSDLVRR